MTKPPGYSHPPLPSFHDSSANIGRAVRRYSQQMNDIGEWTAHIGMPKTYEAIGSFGTTSLQEAIIETMWIGLVSANMPIPDMFGDGWQSTVNIASYSKFCGILPCLIYLLSMTIYETSNWVLRWKWKLNRRPCRTEYNPDYYSRAQIKCHIQCRLQYGITMLVTMQMTSQIAMPVTMQITMPVSMQITMQIRMPVTMQITILNSMMITLPNTMPYLFRRYITDNTPAQVPNTAWAIPSDKTTIPIDDCKLTSQ